MSNDFEQTSFLFASNSVFLEELYQKYQKDPSSVDSSWKEFFENQNVFTPLKSTATIINQPLPKVENVHRKETYSTDSACSSKAINSLKAKFMIMSYREHGHQLAELDPLGLETRKTHNELKLNIEDFGFTQNQLSEKVDITGQLSDISVCTIGELFEILQRTYSGSIAAEFSHVENSAEQKWLYDQLESANTHATFSNEEKKKVLNDLIKIEGFEQYLHAKFPGAKRFSIEGGDTSIICLETAIDYFASNGADEAVLGLAHRGRLSTLTKVMQKPYRAVLSEFTGSSTFPANLDISGDVKYHMGYSSDKVTESGNTIHLSLSPNPSHLEAVNPVVAGKVRAKQDYTGRDRTKVVGILVHGDAAFCGQGVVAESLVMSGLKPYSIGGISHIVINNQIGFTANAGDLRPGRYCTEVAKMVGAPIIHVNGDDVESVILATKIACNYRKKFAKDVVLDIVCYRKYGHNEGDEPMYTQSVMYNAIKIKKSPATIYSEKLIGQSIIGEGYYPKLKQEFKSYLDTEFTQIESYEPQVQWLEGIWSGFEKSGSKKPSTGVAESTLKKLCKKLCTIPESFSINSKLKKLLGNRYDSISKDQPLDWAVAEQLAFATLLKDGTAIRITGQDAGRGTFSHRHAVLHSQTDNTTYEPLNNISKDQAFFEIADSNLSEYGALGFEYGYSLVNPKNLVIWEAQFGDFCNGAQIIFDQFISSSETKWLRMSGLVCLLPHGFEGQGPEHSSARIERFLQLCAEDNMQVVYPTTPASIFHLLRRQMLINVRKPLIIMSPKSLLRHKLAVSSIKEIDKGTAFTPIIDEIDRNVATNSVKKIIFCSGKVYYDLLEIRRDNNIKNIAIIRLEQLYPFEEDLIVKIIQKYKNVTNYIWCQEEPKNMGCWKYIRPNMESALKEAGIRKTIKFVGRPRSASPAVGNLYVHKKQQESLIKEALTILNK